MMMVISSTRKVVDIALGKPNNKTHVVIVDDVAHGTLQMNNMTLFVRGNSWQKSCPPGHLAW
eukprot:73581-Prorocentrum_lima.AAC.1